MNDNLGFVFICSSKIALSGQFRFFFFIISSFIVFCISVYISYETCVLCQQTETLAYYSTYSEEQLQPLSAKLASLVVKAESSKLTVSPTVPLHQ